jgi:HEPN domain-containing protein
LIRTLPAVAIIPYFMILNRTLKYLISHKLRDARVLMKNGRCSAAIYIAGYAIEIALKLKICQNLQFSKGFPETKQEINNYLAQNNKNSTQPLIIHISDVRNHDLSKLLYHSGVESIIRNNLWLEWTIVNQWDPEIRYKKIRTTQKKAEIYLKAAGKIIRKIC